MIMCLRMNSSPAHSPTDSGSALIYKRSRSCGTVTDIDDRIAQAMDLVKIHMLSAVRVEVEPLREKIKNLTKRNIELERENHLLRSMTKYLTALSSGQIANHQTTLTSGQIANQQRALTSGQITNQQTTLTSGHITNQQTALTSGQIANQQTALTSGQIANQQTAMTSGQTANQQTALTSGQIANQQRALTSGQIANQHRALTSGQIAHQQRALTSGQIAHQQRALTSGQITNYQTALNSNHYCSQHGISIPQPSENFIYRSVDCQNSVYFSVNKNLYWNAALKQDVTCV